MYKSKQCCTLEQAKRLNELGVCQDSQFYWRQGHIEHVEGVNSWSDEETLGDMIKIYDSELQPGWREKAELYSAFTVAELGVMLQGVEHLPRKSDRNDYWYVYLNSYQHFKTEAEARAAVLIDLLSRKVVTADQVNLRLKSA